MDRLEAEGVCTEEKLPSVSSINRIVRSNKRYDHNTQSCNSSSSSNCSSADQNPSSTSTGNNQPLKDEPIEPSTNPNQAAIDFINKQMNKSIGAGKAANVGASNANSKLNPQAFNFNNLVPLLVQGRTKLETSDNNGKPKIQR